MEKRNPIGVLIKWIGILEIVVGVIIGLNQDISLYWIIGSVLSGVFIIGFSEVINLLDKIHNAMLQDTKLDNYSENMNATTMVSTIQTTKDGSIQMDGKGMGNYKVLNSVVEIPVRLKIDEKIFLVEDEKNIIIYLPTSNIISCNIHSDSTLSFKFKDENNTEKRFDFIVQETQDKSKKVVEFLNSAINNYL